MTEIHKLLDDIKADFPRRKAAAEELMKRMGLNENVNLTIETPYKTDILPTFDKSVCRNLSPMLIDRFLYAGLWKSGRDCWLGYNDIIHLIRNDDVVSVHFSLREEWEGSAPMRFSDDRLSLFGITEGVPENLIYLVWTDICIEPEIWSYKNYMCNKFDNLEEFLTFVLKRD